MHFNKYMYMYMYIHVVYENSCVYIIIHLIRVHMCTDIHVPVHTCISIS